MPRDSRILIVEDDEGIREALGIALSQYRVIFDCTGLKAVEVYQSARAHLVLLDYLLPNITGLEVQQQLRAYDPNVRTVLITAAVVNEREIMNSTGIRAVLRKPFDLEHLTGVVEHILEE